MADGFKPTYGERNQVIGHKGEKAGQRYDSDEEIKAKKERDEFDKAMGWSGIGGAARRPRGPAYEQKLSDWKKQKARSSGQAKALGAKP